jgi:RHS repeat-associated protein
VRYQYSAAGRLERVIDPLGGITRYTYDPEGRILTITDPRGITFLTNEYDAQGRVSRQLQADGGVWTFAYEGSVGAHTRAAVTDPRGNTTTHRLTPQRLISETLDALGQPTRFERDAQGQLLSSTDALGRITRFEYDAAGNVTRITDPAANVREFAYEPTFNKVTSVKDPLGNTTRFEYDAQGNLTAVVDPLTNRTTIAYNAFGQPISTTDPLGNTTSFTYNGQGDLAAIADPVGNTTTREYDSVSRLVKQTDPLGRPAAFSYDPLNRITTITDAIGGLTQFTYDANGNLLTVTDARGNTITHEYDNMDRLSRRIDQLGVPETFEYDGLGNLTRHVDRKGQVATFTHDSLNRRVGATYADSTTSFVYDAGGRLVRATDSVSGDILNTYDNLDRLTAQATTLGTISYEYDQLGRRRTMTTPGQPPVSYSYDAASRLVQIVQGPQVVDFQHDALGRRTKLALPNQVSTDYQYDAASRLTALIYRNALGPLGDLTYQYDASGNRVAVGGSFARTLLPDPVASSNYDAANRQLQFGNRTLTYDLNGNLVNDGPQAYTWNARNQLTAISGPTPGAFVYDGLGRRGRKTINGAATEFLYDGNNPAQELVPGITTSLLTGLGIDEYFARTDLVGMRTFLTDALGSTVALADPAGAVETQYTYQAFGATTVTGAPSTNPFGWTGRELDGTSLQFLRARYYSPTLHRFISEDPLGPVGGRNYYRYVQNNPLTLTDPTGLFAGTLAARGLNFALRSGLASEEIGLIGKFTDASIGFIAGVAGPLIPPNISEMPIPGAGGLTVGDAGAILTGVGGIQTLTLTSGIVSSAGLAGASIAAAGAGTVAATVGLAGAGGWAIGSSINDLFLNNRRIFPGGNPLENLVWDLFFAEPPKGSFGTGR